MLAYLVTSVQASIPGNYQYFYISLDKFPDGDTPEEMTLLIRNDYKFCFFRGRTWRVCQVEFDDDRFFGGDEPFIKTWLQDPFAGYDDYEQIDDVQVDSFGPEYCI